MSQGYEIGAAMATTAITTYLDGYETAVAQIERVRRRDGTLPDLRPELDAHWALVSEHAGTESALYHAGICRALRQVMA